MTSFRTSITAAFALTVATFGAAVSTPASAQLLTAAQLQAYEATRGQSRCPRSLDETNVWVKQLTTNAARSRARAEQNPIYLADVGFDDAELSFAKSCVQNVAANAR